METELLAQPAVMGSPSRAMKEETIVFEFGLVLVV
jgi:hypothetical protein